MMAPPPMPVPAATSSELLMPREAPAAASPRAWAWTSLTARTGCPVRDSSSAVSSVPAQPANDSVAETTTPVAGLTTPAEATPIRQSRSTEERAARAESPPTEPASASPLPAAESAAREACASAMTAATTSATVSSTAAAPSAAGVGTPRTCLSTPPMTEPARIFVPPMSTATVAGRVTAALRR